MMLRCRAKIIALLAVTLVAACDDTPPPKAPGTASTAPAKPKQKLADLPAQMVSAVSAGKSSAMISVHFVLEAPPAVGKSLPVDIAIVPHRLFTSVRASFEAPDTLSMTEGNKFDQQKDVPAESVLKHRLMLQPSQEGVFLVTAAVETEGEDGSVTRIYSIPIIIHAAGPTEKPAAIPSTEPATG